MPEPAGEQIEVRDGQGRVTHVPLAGPRMDIGRGADAAVRLDSATVSRRHAELFTDPFGRWWVRDLKSRNGTLVNGKLVTESLLNAGDTVQIEDFFLTYKAALTASFPGGTRSASDSGITLMESAAAPIRKLADLEAPKIAAAHLRALTELGAKLLATADAHERIETLCRLMISPEFHGNTAVALRVPRQDAAAEPAVVCPPQSARNWRSGELPYVSKTLLRSVRQNNAPVVASNVGSTGVVELSLAGNVMSMAAIACPLETDAQRMDLLYVTFPPEFGTGEWLALAALAAEQFQQATTVWAARRAAEQQAIIEGELRHANEIQMRLVLRKVEAPGVDVGIGFEPCRWVGGDYIDAVPLADGRLFVTIADVCGKGLQAALITATLHAMIHTGAAGATGVTDLMSRINDYLCATLPDESFATMVGLTLDPGTGEIECINAGHWPPLLIEAGGLPRELQKEKHPPLGFMPQEFEVQRDRIERGQVLALYTDGLIELKNEEGEMLGPDRLAGMLRGLYDAANGASATELSRHLKTALDGYQGQAMASDDRTFLLIRRV